MKSLLQEMKFFFKQMFLVAQKDFKSMLFSPLFFVWSGISFIFLSYIFPRDLFRFAMSYAMPVMGGDPNQGGNIHFNVFVAHISYINLILLFSIPVLGMKLLAEEKQNHTFDLLMTAPLSSFQMILGKYFALISLLLVFLLCSLFYPLSTGLFVEIPLGPLFSSYLGLFCLVVLYSSVALFASSLSSSLFLSAFIGMIFNISLWFISQQGVGDSGLISSVMSYISIASHLTNFIKGSIVISSIVFFLSSACFFLFLVFKSVEFVRWRA
ncbi:MAG: ABC transporter permease [Bdellovibrionales bacterium]|nr:ABC transporter permease [Bdellovibrionales bacterium]